MSRADYLSGERDKSRAQYQKLRVLVDDFLDNLRGWTLDEESEKTRAKLAALLADPDSEVSS